MSIKELEREGRSIRAVARETGHSRNTVRKVVRGEHSEERRASPRRSKLDPYKEYVAKRYEEHQLSAVRILEEIRPMGYEGSVQTLRRYLQRLKAPSSAKARVTVRFETPPGKQAQVDWGYCGRFAGRDGKTISVYVFVMVLSYSRQLFVHFTRSMRLAELLRCHVLAFDAFGGWPQTILYDNMKQVRLSRSRWNEQFLDFANHYGFTPKTCKPYRPRTKGKVERAVAYVKGSFLAGRAFAGLDELNAQAQQWLAQTANVRIHGTTGERPLDLLANEKLTTVGSVPPYSYSAPVSRTVTWESMVRYAGSRYSVPPEHAGKSVQVASQGGLISIRLGDTVIAEHREAARAGQCIVRREHMAELWRITNERVDGPPAKRWEIHFRDDVETMPLARFEEVLS